MSINIGSTTKDTCGVGDYRKIRCDDDGYTEITNPSGTALNVFTHAHLSPIINLYLYKTSVTPSLTSAVVVDDVVLDIDDNAGITNGHAITIKEDSCCFQSIVKSTTAPPSATLTLQSPSDCAFTTDATVEIGNWNMNVNGEGGTIEYIITPPTDVNFDIYTITVSMTDGSVMDSGKFGGITALLNGFVIRREDGTHKNICLCVNNIGFKEQGFITTYDDKAPAGIYGVTHKLNLVDNYGTAIRLNGSSADALKVLIRDNLTTLTGINCTIGGHVAEGL